jgi:cytosine deaminase
MHEIKRKVTCLIKKLIPFEAWNYSPFCFDRIGLSGYFMQLRYQLQVEQESRIGMSANKENAGNKENQSSSFILKHVRPMGSSSTDILVRDGIIQQITPDIKYPGDDAIIYEGHNNLLLPGLVNAHAHVDKNLLGVPWQRNEVPDSANADLIAYDLSVWKKLALSSRVQSALQVRASIAAGITHIRSHVDVQPEYGAQHFEGVLAIREEYKDTLTMQLVAFPQVGILPSPGVLEIMEDALRQGMECVGGNDPSSHNRDPVAHLDAVFGLADRFGKEIDIHLHEPGPLGAFSVELIAERTHALGMQGQVTISHAFCLGMVNDTYLTKLIDLLLENRITIQSAGAGGTPLPPIKKLVEAGVSMCIGTDDVRNPWSAYNSVDMLDRVKMLGYRCRFKRDDEIEMLLGLATTGGAQVMGDQNYGLEVGKQADFVVLPGETPVQVVIDQPKRTYVFKQGHLVAKDGEFLIPG